MSWSDVGDAVKEYAPIVGMALSSPMGAAVAVGQLVANIFGTKADPQDVLNYINTDPQKASERLQYELANNVEFQKVLLGKIQESNRHEEANTQLIVQDKDSARKNSENINKSPIDNWIKMFVVISQLTLFAFCLLILLTTPNLSATSSGMLGTVIGILGKSLSSLVDFYWGSAYSDPTK